MAPALVETATITQTDYNFKSGVGQYKEAAFGGPKVFEKELELRGTDKHAPAKYPNYLPVWNEKVKYAPLEPFEHYEHGKDADPAFPNLLKDAKVADLTANIGAEVTGVQLSKLTDAGKDELALFVAQKKVVAFRDQDFADLAIKDALDIGGYFGRHHIHPTSGAPEGYPEVHLVHRGTDDTSARDFFEERTNSITWHSDVTYEKQPPGTTFLYLLDGPAAGGDTLFANQAAAYNRLSAEFRKRLQGLKVVHSAVEQADNSKNRGGIVRREAVTSIHPLVRTHPVTGEKALFVNPQFSRRIVGFKKEESDFLLNFLYDHIAKGQDFQARVKWAPGTVVVWDNRVTAHSALLDWDDGARRHLARITPQAEAPFETPFEERTGSAPGFEY
ncbi:TauD-domain-containing protein [Dothidotthia symphoricarpi CBS 119687]|uniref:TauD-domain-containing protein n=1 Tax=Dothidotthia symphoricarpi CBS 119687 TaxID=1392245 RepID=A0A6A6AG24_9PLEO|nr:TauD-domain-containing protein [Dothidotthia symphoricarpi CBS 119687]KAF2130740.1 TauD-domain-containing protein [Dothidotthia symphoricarpi CBS 119687]